MKTSQQTEQTFQPIGSKNEHKRACPVVFPPHGPENIYKKYLPGTSDQTI